MKNKILLKLNDVKNNLDFTKLKVEVFYLLYVLTIYLLLFLISYIFGVNLSGNVTWFWGGFAMLIFSIYYIEPHFTAPTNVFTNSFALFLLIGSLNIEDFGSYFWWWSSISILAIIILFSLFSKIIYNKNKSDDFIINNITNKITSTLELFGSGKVLYSASFIYFLLLNIFSQKQIFNNFYLLILFLLFCWVLVVTPKTIKDFFNKYFKKNYKNKSDNLGKIFSVQSDNVFMVKLFDDKKVNKFLPVYFFHNMTQENSKNIAVGLLFDIYYLDNQKFGKIIKIDSVEKTEITINKIDHDYVYKINGYVNKKIEAFVGLINENSTIERIYFEYSQQDNDVEIDDLLEVKIRDRKVFYQIINSKTSIEKLESYNEKGLIIGEAIQVGCWNSEEMSFNKLGWVPMMNEPVYKANTKDEFDSIKKDVNGKVGLLENEMQIGVIPKTKLPSIIKLDEAISHHTAILGVTGSGKSVFARKIIENISKDTKVFCVDLNEEFHKNMKNVQDLIDEVNIEVIKNDLEYISSQLSEFENKRDKDPGGKFKWKNKQEDLVKTIKEKISTHLNSNINNISVLNIPEISNTETSFAYVRYFFKCLFEIAREEMKNSNLKKMCIVIEEAHTVVPEWNTSGSSEKNSQALVNTIGQIALQGRKYGIGLVVIGQRSANISKTVLTQCNTIVAFKAFDDTSYGFLTNYFGKTIIQSIPNLKNYHAVVYGKGIKSNNPIIIDTTNENL